MMVRVLYLGISEFWADADWDLSDPVGLFNDPLDTEPYLIVPHANLTIAPAEPVIPEEPLTVGLPLWDVDGRVWIRRHDTGMWVSPTPTGITQKAWADLAHPLSRSPSGPIVVDISGQQFYRFAAELRDLFLSAQRSGAGRGEVLPALARILNRRLQRFGLTFV